MKDQELVKRIMAQGEAVTMTITSNNGDVATFDVTIEGSDEVIDVGQIEREEETVGQFLANLPVGHVNKGRRKESNDVEFAVLRTAAQRVRTAE